MRGSPGKSRFFNNFVDNCLFSNFHRVGLFQVFERDPRCGAITPVNLEVPSPGCETRVAGTGGWVDGKTVVFGKCVAVLTVVHNILQDSMRAAFIIDLREHVLSNDVGGDGAVCSYDPVTCDSVCVVEAMNEIRSDLPVPG